MYMAPGLVLEMVYWNLITLTAIIYKGSLIKKIIFRNFLLFNIYIFIFHNTYHAGGLLMETKTEWMNGRGHLNNEPRKPKKEKTENPWEPFAIN